MDTLYTFGENSTHYKTESVHFAGLMNSATQLLRLRSYRTFGTNSCSEGLRAWVAGLQLRRFGVGAQYLGRV